MDDLIADFHIHSKYSYDSLMSPEGIVKRAKKVGLTCVAITDHNTIRGGIEGKKYERTYGVEVIVGAEIKTDCGDIIGLNLNDEIGVTGWREVIKGIRLQGGTVVLPHPYRDHSHIEEISQCVDFIEIWNARSSPQENARAEQLAGHMNKKRMMGSDAHIYGEIGLVKSRVAPESLELTEMLCRELSQPWDIQKSQIISHVKRGDFAALVIQGGSFLWRRIT